MTARFWRRLALLQLGFILGAVAELLYLFHVFSPQWDAYACGRVLMAGVLGVFCMWFGIFMFRIAEMRQ